MELFPPKIGGNRGGIPGVPIKGDHSTLTSVPEVVISANQFFGRIEKLISPLKIFVVVYSKRHYSQNAQLYVDTHKTAFLSFFVTILRIGLLNVDRHIIYEVIS